MFVSHRSDPDRTKSLEGFESSVLLEATDLMDTSFAVTWNDVVPGAYRGTHSHEPEQAYVMVRGSGTMQVGHETVNVRAGDLVFVPSWIEHGISNTGSDLLTYVAITAPSVAFTENWAQASEADDAQQ